MSKLVIASLASFLMARTAAANPPEEHGFVGGGVVLGASGNFLDAALALEGGVAIPGVPLAIHGLLAKGSSFDFEGGGALERGLVGLEMRLCHSEVLCGFGAIELGYQTQTWSSRDEMTEHHAGALFGPRVGLDVGGDRVRFRFAFELMRYEHHVDVMTAGASTADTSAGFTLSLVYRL